MASFRSAVIIVVCFVALAAIALAAEPSLSGQPGSRDLSSPHSLDLDLNNSRPGTSGNFDCPPRPIESTGDGKNASQSLIPSWISLCLAGEYGHTTTDLDRVDDARAFTSEAQFAQSSLRLNRLLTRGELRAIARARDEAESRNRLTFNLGDLTFVDVFLHYRHADNAQITNFFLPTQTNPIDVLEYGIFPEKSWRLGDNRSVTLGLGFSRARREGLVEFLPNNREFANQYSVRVGAQDTSPIGKMVLNGNYDHQVIDTVGLPAYSHDRSIYGVRLALFSPRAVATKESSGTQYLVGVAHDVERYGTVNVPKDDYFAGITLYGNKPFGEQGPAVDLTVLPAALTSTVNNNSSQKNSQYRTNLVLATDLNRWVASGLDKLTLSVPFRHDVTVQGPAYFENYRLGLHLNAAAAPFGTGTAKLQVSIGYDFQSFYNIGKSLHLLGVRLSASF